MKSLYFLKMKLVQYTFPLENICDSVIKLYDKIKRNTFIEKILFALNRG